MVLKKLAVIAPVILEVLKKTSCYCPCYIKGIENKLAAIVPVI